MEPYEIYLFLHIAAAIVWVGGVTALGVLMGRLQKADAGPAMGAIGAQMEFFSKAVFMPASLVTFLAGAAMVLTSDGAITFEEPWVAIGVAGFLITVAVGMAILRPTAVKVAALGMEKGPGAPEVVALRARMKRVSGINTVILWVVVAAMVFKPGA